MKKPPKINRFNVMQTVLMVLMLVLVGRLFKLTIIDGDKYRYVADNKRVKEIKITAPRGNIYDRNGKILAGTKPSYAVKLFKDDLSRAKLEDKNAMFTDLVRILEEEGSPYVKSFPIEINALVYHSEVEYYKNETTPTDRVLDLIFEHELTRPILEAYTEEGGYFYAPIASVLHSLDLKGIDVPVHIEKNAGLHLEYDGGKETEEFFRKNGFERSSDPIDAINALVKEDRSTFRKILTQPLGRKLVYEILSARGLGKEIELKDKVLTYDEEIRIIKSQLNKDFPEITAESDVKDDFFAIVKKQGLATLLTTAYQNGETTVIPAQILIDELMAKGVDVPVLVTEPVSGKVSIEFIKKTTFSRDLPLDRLIAIAKEQKVLKDFILSDEIAPYAQSAILDAGVNPRINVRAWEYTPIKNKKDMMERYDFEETPTMDELFTAMKEYYDYENESDYIARGVLALHDRLLSQGHYGYAPITLTYGLSHEAVARIEEAIPSNRGIEVSVEPIRYYPERDLAAHVIGYLGKIAQEEEIKSYVEELGYDPDDIIGKTGVEESYESVLRGKKGKKTVEIDVVGNRTDTLEEIAPEPGDNVFLTIDAELQKTAHDALTKTLALVQEGTPWEDEWGVVPFATNGGTPYYNANAGAVVVMNVKTGEILAKANAPTFNLNPFSTGITESDWQALFPPNENDVIAPRPLYDIAMQTAVQPGSIFKLSSTLAAFEKGLSPDEQIFDSGVLTIGDTKFACHVWDPVGQNTHGWVDSRAAIEHSCNYYYYALALGKNQSSGQETGVKLEIDDLIEMAKKLGLGEKTGIEVHSPAENPGLVPDPAAKLRIRKKQLTDFLENNLEKYYEEGYRYNKNDVTWSIHTITSWLDETPVRSREEVLEELTDLHFVAETPLPGQRAGLADIIKYDYLEQANWDITDTLNVIIGQGPNAYTPLQMARYICCFANGGYKVKAHVISKVMNPDNTEIIEQTVPEKERIDLKDPRHLQPILEGMLLAKDVSGKTFVNFPMKVGVKTGTAQNTAINPNTGQMYDNYGWFLAFAPYDDPEIAIATILFQGGSGVNAAPLNRAIIAHYFGMKPEANP